MKTRNVFAGVVVVALGVGIWLGSFLKGPGLGGLGTGFGTGPQDGNSQDGNSQDGSSQDQETGPAHVHSSVQRGSAPISTSIDSLEDSPTDLMTVVIYGNEYRLVNGETPQSGTVLSLQDIAARAKKMTGTPEGIRVRILKGKSAQEGARADLLKWLEESGVKQEEIQERAEFVD